MSIESIRNIVVIGQSSSGKTSLLETILFNAKITTRIGKTDDGSSVLDYLDEEVKRKMSISLSLAQFEYKKVKYNFIDTPGYVDFIGEPISAMYAGDVALIVVDGVEGIHFHTTKLVDFAEKRGLAKILFINKMDKENANYDTIVENFRKHYSVSLPVITIPVKEGNEIKGVINLIEDKYYKIEGNEIKIEDIPDSEKSNIEEAKTKMIESIAETDESLMEKYFDAGTLEKEEMIKGIKKAMAEGGLIPVFTGSALFNIGALSLLEFIGECAPSPADRKPVKALKPDTNEEIECKPSVDEPLKALVFKTFAESHIGELNFVRVFSGKLENGMEVYNSTKETTEKIGQMFQFVGKERKEVKSIEAGDICALVKLKQTSAGDTLCDKNNPVKFPPIEYPKPLLDIAIVPKTKADQDKLSTSIHKLMEEEPTIKIKIDPELKQTIISGMGEIQLTIFINKLKEKYNVNVETARPKVPYRETIKKKAQAQGKYKRQTGGRGQYGDCWIEVEPLPINGDKDFEFIDNIVGGVIPAKYIPAVEKGVKEAMSKGILAGYPVIKVKVRLYDGSFHPVDSSDIAFQIAGSLAFKNAATQASPVLLEPVYKVKIYAPDNYVGDIMSDLNSRRGKILGMDKEKGLTVINAYIPQAEMYKYINVLKSITQGSGTYEAEFDHYEEVPHDIAQKIIEEAQKEKEEQ